MRKSLNVIVLSITILMFSQVVTAAESLQVSAQDNIGTILSAQKDKRVTVKLNSGDELTGYVGEVNNDVVHLRELSGKEFFDAIIAKDKITAVILRTRNQ